MLSLSSLSLPPPLVYRCKPCAFHCVINNKRLSPVKRGEREANEKNVFSTRHKRIQGRILPSSSFFIFTSCSPIKTILKLNYISTFLLISREEIDSWFTQTHIFTNILCRAGAGRMIKIFIANCYVAHAVWAREWAVKSKGRGKKERKQNLYKKSKTRKQRRQTVKGKENKEENKKRSKNW